MDVVQEFVAEKDPFYNITKFGVSGASKVGCTYIGGILLSAMAVIIVRGFDRFRNNDIMSYLQK